MGEAKGGGVEKRAHARKAGGAELSTNFSKLYQLNFKNFIYYGSHPSVKTLKISYHRHT